ncbi:MAG: DUF799 domain-containing protein [Bacteroidales bacterium]|jgi:hypothetical protein|nr:DUF799 domain-containing protein [Bacteroidales bacterium]
MKKILYLYLIVLLYSCSSTQLKKDAYKGLYEEKPVSVLIMPPINRSTDVDAKEYFHSTLLTPLANAGYYVIPPFLSMEILKKESAYDAELFMDAPLNKFGKIFGADLVLFTVINKWDKSKLAGKIYVELEYIFKSTKTNEVCYSRTAKINYNTSISGSGSLLADMVLTAISTAATKYVAVARESNKFTLKDLPVGKYHPKYQNDGDETAGAKIFKKNLP